MNAAYQTVSSNYPVIPKIISSFLRSQESTRFCSQNALHQQGILDSRFRGNDGSFAGMTGPLWEWRFWILADLDYSGS